MSVEPHIARMHSQFSWRMSSSQKRAIFAELWLAQGGICWLCKTAMNKQLGSGRRDASIDHFIPLCDGGTDAPDNLLLAHVYCNNRRGHNSLMMSCEPPPKKVRL